MDYKVTTFKKFISESIEDRGILKAIFVLGIPGAGKSYTARKIAGTVSPLIVNTDKSSEFLSRKLGINITSKTWNNYFKDSSQRITKNALFNYVNGMLPLLVDGTSSDVINILHRMDILESLGYDIGIVFVNTSLEVAKKRVETRALEIGRYVDTDWIESIHEQNKESRNFLKTRVNFFKDVFNDNGELTDDVMMEAFKKVQKFYLSPLLNPVGKRLIDELKSKKEKYLIPAYLTREELGNRIDGWYK